MTTLKAAVLAPIARPIDVMTTRLTPGRVRVMRSAQDIVAEGGERAWASHHDRCADNIDDGSNSETHGGPEAPAPFVRVERGECVGGVGREIADSPRGASEETDGPGFEAAHRVLFRNGRASLTRTAIWSVRSAATARPALVTR